MKANFLRTATAGLLAIFAACASSCYPAYPPANGYSSYNGGSAKDGYLGSGEPPEPAPRPYAPYVGVDPGLAIAGAAAAGLLGYAISHHHDHHYYYGGPRYYGHGYHGGYYHCR